MYFFYIDESGSRDPRARISGNARDHLYVLSAASLFDRRWSAFDQEICRHKLRLRHKLFHEKQIELNSLADCEVKSTNIRLKKQPHEKGYSRFVHNLEDSEKPP